VLLHVVSLPGGQGIGDMGPEAYRFVDWLAAAGQQMWQILPLGPTGYGDSPYASSSAFASNLDLVSLELLVGDGLLTADELGNNLPTDHVDYPNVHKLKEWALRQAFARFSGGSELDEFCRRSAYWLDDYVAVEARREQGEAAFLRFAQFELDRQWSALKRYANDRHVRIVGDVPIFVADGSVDVLAHPELFLLDVKGRPTHVAGVPPDLFSDTGQRWGNPLYNWEVMAANGYQWWRDRLRRTLELVDVARIDHFRAFAAHWTVPASEETAVRGEWRRGPGTTLFHEVGRELGNLPIVVEDLGLITTDVIEVRDELGYPGMKVLQFAFDGKADNPYLPHNYTSEAMVYTGTHDNDTTVGWYQQLPEGDKHAVRQYLGTDATDVSWDMIRLASGSVARMAIFPAQDLLSLGAEARFNFPGKAQGNWSWRLQPGQLSDPLAARLDDLTSYYNRLPRPGPGEPEPVKDYPFGTAAINSGL
jgi:4-alpha-glucanotransferase